MRRLLTLCSAALTLVHVAGSIPPVKVALKSSWASPSLSETILWASHVHDKVFSNWLLRETVSLEYPDKFFDFLDQLLAQAAPADDDGHESLLEFASSSGVVEDAEALARITMNLALSSATPKLEAFYNYYESNYGEPSTVPCESWVDWYGAVICDSEALARLIEKELEDLYGSSSVVYVLLTLRWNLLLTGLVWTVRLDRNFCLSITSIRLNTDHSLDPL